jgi:hypothetical protein
MSRRWNSSVSREVSTAEAAGVATYEFTRM